MFSPPLTLKNEHATLEPLAIGHAAALFRVTAPDTFRYFPFCPASWTPPAFEVFVREAITDPTRRAFLVRDRSGAVVGSTSYLDVNEKHRTLEIGATWYAPASRGTRVNPAAKLLLMEHAFEALGCIRVQLKCDERNIRSQRAIAKLGAVREGVLRHNMIMPDGHLRNTVYFGVVAPEWPGVKAGLRARLAGGQST